MNPPLDSNTRDPELDEELPEGYEDDGLCVDCGLPHDECECDDDE